MRKMAPFVSPPDFWQMIDEVVEREKRKEEGGGYHRRWDADGLG